MSLSTWDDVRVWVYSPDRAKRWPVFDYLSLSVERGKHPQGSMSIEVPPATLDLWGDLFDITSRHFGALISFDVFLRDMTTPWWSGPITSLSVAHERGYRTSRVNCQQHFFEHFLGRRLLLTAAGAKADSGSNAAYAGPSDGALWALLYDNGFSAFSYTPAAYPVGVTRDDFGTWACTANTPGMTSGVTVDFELGDSRRILEAALDIAEKGGLSLALTEVSAGVFEIDIGDTYQQNDRTNTVILSPKFGTASTWSFEHGWDALENVLKMKGKTTTTGGGYQMDDQVLFLEDSGSVTDYGVYEGALNIPDASNAVLGDEIAYQVARQSSPFPSYEVGASDLSAPLFNEDYAIGDLVTIRSEAWGRDEQRLVIGGKLSVSGRQRSIQVLLGEPPRSARAALKELPYGQRGGAGAGSRFVSTKG